MSFFKKKEVPPPDMSVTEVLQLNHHLDDIIDTWVRRELVKGLVPESKLMEIALFNFKLIFADLDVSEDLRKFLSNTSNITGSADYTFSRIQDLYISIRMTFPSYYIDSLHLRFVETIDTFGYPIEEDLVDTTEYGWMLHKIQQRIRYYSTAGDDIKKKG